VGDAAPDGAATTFPQRQTASIPVAGAEAVFSEGDVIRSTLPPWPGYRLSFGLDLHQDAAVDVLFGLTSADRDTPAGLVLRVAPQGVFLGRRLEDGGEVRQMTPRLPLSENAGRDEGWACRQVVLERRGRIWRVSFDRVVVGTAAIREAERAEFRLAIVAGKALFHTMDAVALVRLNSPLKV
jgi:hypothetical protein